jgi:uncharacterized protein YbjT (DUF2867 family)
MNLTVFGATGGVGREVVTQALDAGHHLTAYVRNPAKLTVTHAARRPACRSSAAPARSSRRWFSAGAYA